jgi:hypothetical protein
MAMVRSQSWTVKVEHCQPAITARARASVIRLAIDNMLIFDLAGVTLTLHHPDPSECPGEVGADLLDAAAPLGLYFA